VWTPLNEEQCSVVSVYSTILHSVKLQLIYAITQVKLLRGNYRVEGERMRETGERVGDCVLLRMGFGVSNKFDS
jgi:hypothetical protein